MFFQLWQQAAAESDEGNQFLFFGGPIRDLLGIHCENGAIQITCAGMVNKNYKMN